MKFYKIELYDKALNKFDDINFTKREIDVIACIIHNRSDKKIAELLDISIKTINVHIGHITSKIKINSREHIINFITHFDRINLFTQYYFILTCEYTFKNFIKEIKPISAQLVANLIIHSTDMTAAEQLTLNSIKFHLNLAGANVLSNSSNHIKFHNIHILNNSLTKYKLSDILLVLDPQYELANQDTKKKFIFTDYREYYRTLLLLLQEIFQESKLANTINQYIEKYRLINNSFEQEDIIQTVQENTYFKNKIFSKRYIFLVVVLTIFTYIVSVKHNYIFVKNIDTLDLTLPHNKLLLPRQNVIDDIEFKLSAQTGIKSVIITGTGGIGKTVIARMFSKSKTYSLVWEINAEHVEHIEASLESLAYILAQNIDDNQILIDNKKVKLRRYRIIQLLGFIKNKLAHLKDWLLIYDNVESFKDVIDFIPDDSNSWGSGTVLITTRNINVQYNSQIHKTVLIPELNSSEKEKLFKNIMYSTAINFVDVLKTSKAMGPFLENIPSFPLDVVTAAYYLKMTNISYDKYLEYMTIQNQDFLNLIKNIANDSGGYTQTRYDIVLLSLQKIISLNNDYIDLMLLINMLGGQNISCELLYDYKSKIIVDGFLYNLKKYSLIHTNKDPVSKNTISISLHRSTTNIVRNYFENLQGHDYYQNSLDHSLCYIDNYMNNILANENLDDIRNIIIFCHNLLSFKNSSITKRAAIFMNHLGQSYHYLGDYDQSLKFLQRALNILNNEKCKDFRQIAKVSYILATVYKTLGLNAQCSKNFKLSLKLYKQYFANEHINIAKITADMGNFYRSIGDYKKAKMMLNQALNIYKNYIPDDHINIAWILLFLGYTEEELGNYLQAKTYFEHSLSICDRFLAKNPVKKAWALANIGNMYNQLDYTEQALGYINQAISICKEQALDTHKGYAITLMYAGDAYQNSNNYIKAKYFYKQAVSIFNKYMPEDLINIAWSRSRLAMAEYILGNRDTALQQINQSLMDYRKIYTQDNGKIGKLIAEMSKIYFLNDQLVEAEKFYIQSLKILQQNCYNSSYSVLESLAELYFKKSLMSKKEIKFYNQQQAISCLKQALKIVEVSIGTDSPHYLRIFNKIQLAL